MIRNETEYQEATTRLQGERERATTLKKELKSQGKATDEIKRLADPMESFHLQLAEEVESYERLKRGQFTEIENLHGLGRLLVGLRIAQSHSVNWPRNLAFTKLRSRAMSVTSTTV